MGHKKRSITRPAEYREDYLIVIAVEGAKTEKHYFKAINNVHRFSRFKIHIIPNIEDKSAPGHIITNLDSYTEKYEVDAKDFLYLACDRDRWEERTLAEVLTKCKQKNYNFIISNPCFELWLLLHFKDLSNLTEQEQMNYLENEKINRNIKFLSSELRNYLQGYNHSYNEFEKIVAITYLRTAINYAAKLDTGEGGWPLKLGTQVFKIAEKIVQMIDNKE